MPKQSKVSDKFYSARGLVEIAFTAQPKVRTQAHSDTGPEASEAYSFAMID